MMISCRHYTMHVTANCCNFKLVLNFKVVPTMLKYAVSTFSKGDVDDGRC